MQEKIIAQFHGSNTKKQKKNLTITGIVLACIYFVLMFNIIIGNLDNGFFGISFILYGVAIFLVFRIIGVIVDKTSKSKSWKLTENNLYIGEEKIPLSEINHVSHNMSTNSAKGCIQVMHGKVSSFYYPHYQAALGMQAAEYLMVYVGGEDAKKKIERQKDIRANGFRKKCNVCGHIYCYDFDDIAKNKKHANQALMSSIAGVGGALGGYYTASAVHGQSADNEINRIVDYTKCPKCGSRNIVDATEEDIQNSKKPQGQPVQQLSSADELKKYKELLDQGVITQEEFEAKKKQLLGL